VLVLDGTLALVDGAILLAALAVYIAITVRVGRREGAAIQEEYRDEVTPSTVRPRERLRDIGLFAVGLVLLVVGAQSLVIGASSVARSLGISELVVGLTVVALGTSLPELVTSAIASMRGHRDIAVGNVMGSNLFNILGILGISAIVAPGGIGVAEQVRAFDIPVMTAVAVACLPLLFTGYELRRWEGVIFVAYAVLYTAYVVLEATDDPFSDRFGAAMLWFVLPLTVLTLATVLVRELAARRRLPTPPG
jgi:cation:H+ antiporter